jgi:hypothetical protein
MSICLSCICDTTYCICTVKQPLKTVVKRQPITLQAWRNILEALAIRCQWKSIQYNLTQLIITEDQRQSLFHDICNTVDKALENTCSFYKDTSCNAGCLICDGYMLRECGGCMECNECGVIMSHTCDAWHYKQVLPTKRWKQRSKRRPCDKVTCAVCNEPVPTVYQICDDCGRHLCDACHEEEWCTCMSVHASVDLNDEERIALILQYSGICPECIQESARCVC